MSGVGYVVRRMVVEVKEGTATAVAYECAVTGVQEGLSQDQPTTATACPDGTITDLGPEQWSLTINYNISMVPDSFHRILRTHAGKVATVTIEPFPDQEPGHKVAYDVTLTPGAADTTVGAFGTASVTLPVRGKPQHIDPTTP
jgi:hypothetical protein